MQSSEKQTWCYIVRVLPGDQDDLNPNFFTHKSKEEALRRAKGYMMISLKNFVSDYKMGKPLSRLHDITFRLSYAELSNTGEPYNEVAVEEIPLSNHLGNYAV